MAVLIIAEKPSVAQNIASVLKANSRNDGYYEGNNYIITFAFGHLFTVYDFKDYDSKYAKWNIEDYPFFPEPFQYKPINDNGVKKQLAIIKQLCNRVDVDYIINACDGDREGELIFTLVVKGLGVKKPTKRLWISEQTPQDIYNGMSRLRDNSSMINLQLAAFTRQQIDCLLGFNLTAAATVKYGNGTMLNIGRVLCPTTKLIYDRHFEIKKFKPESYYRLAAIFEASGGSYTGFLLLANENLKKNIGELNKIKDLISSLQGTITKLDTKIAKEGPKKLFNLTDLQGYITSHYKGWSSTKVLDVAQSLYEHKFITYPRTASRHLEDTLKSKMEKVLNALSQGKLEFNANSNIFDSSKVESHSAITPTYILPNESELSQDEAIVYREIKNKFLSHFMPAAEYEITSVITRVGDYDFKTDAKVLKKPGWKALYSEDLLSMDDKEKENDDIEFSNKLPDLKLHENVKLSNGEVITKYTTPPKLYTEATLLKAMEDCGKKIIEDEVEHILKGFSLGTSATRANVIDSILKAGYVAKKGKSFDITEMGIKFVEILPIDDLFDINFTGLLEKKLKDIEVGQYSKASYLEEIRRLIENCISSMKGIDASIGVKAEKKIIGKCPDCGGDIQDKGDFYGCSNFKDKQCKFCISKNNKLLEKFGVKNIKESWMKKLLITRRFRLVLNYTKVIIVSLEKIEGRWGLQFEFLDKDASKEAIEPICSCPGCGKNIYEDAYKFACESYDKDNPASCKCMIWKSNKLLEKYNIKGINKSLAKKLFTLEKVIIPLSYRKSLYAQLKRNGDVWNLSLEFPTEEENIALRDVIGKCPDCGANVYENNAAFACERNTKENKSCSFILFKENKWFTDKGKKVTASIAKAMLNDNRVFIKGLKKKDGSGTYDATVILKKNGQYWGFEIESFKK